MKILPFDPDARVTGLRIDPTGQYLVLLSDSHWQVLPIKQLLLTDSTVPLQPITEHLTDCAWHPLGGHYIVGTLYSTLHQHVAPGRQRHDLPIYQNMTGPVTAVAYSPQGRTLVASSGWHGDPSVVSFIDPLDWSLRSKTTSTQGQIGYLAFRDEQSLFWGTNTGIIECYDIEYSTLLRSAQVNTKAIDQLRLSVDGEYVAYTDDRTVFLHRSSDFLLTHQPIEPLYHFPGDVGTIAWAPDGLTLYILDQSGRLSQWSRQSRQLVRRWELPRQRATCFDLSPDGTIAIIHGRQFGFVILDLE